MRRFLISDAFKPRKGKKQVTVTKFLGFSIAATAFLVLTACSSTPQNQSPQSQTQTSTPAATINPSSQAMEHGNMSGMDHSMMDHSMMMDLGPADAEYDLRFIDAMIPHHRGAIDMANEALQKSQRAEIKSLAQNIIEAQNREENELMRNWRKAWYPNAPETPMAYNSQQGKTLPMAAEQKNSMMMKMDLGPADAEYDLRFMNAMIPHHQGAVVMAKDALTKSKRPEITKLAQDIISSQEAEIKQMQQWKQTWYEK